MPTIFPFAVRQWFITKIQLVYHPFGHLGCSKLLVIMSKAMKHLRQYFCFSSTQFCFSCWLPEVVVLHGECTPACVRGWHTVSGRLGNLQFQQLGESSAHSAALLAISSSFKVIFSYCCFLQSPVFSHSVYCESVSTSLVMDGPECLSSVLINHLPGTTVWWAAAIDSFAFLLLSCWFSHWVWAILSIFWI